MGLTSSSVMRGVALTPFCECFSTSDWTGGSAGSSVLVDSAEVLIVSAERWMLRQKTLQLEIAGAWHGLLI